MKCTWLLSYLGIVADDFFTFLAGVGVQAVVAGDAVGIVLHLDVLASVQRLVAVMAVESVTHDVYLFCLVSFFFFQDDTLQNKEVTQPVQHLVLVRGQSRKEEEE